MISHSIPLAYKYRYAIISISNQRNNRGQVIKMTDIVKEQASNSSVGIIWWGFGAFVVLTAWTLFSSWHSYNNDPISSERMSNVVAIADGVGLNASREKKVLPLIESAIKDKVITLAEYKRILAAYQIESESLEREISLSEITSRLEAKTTKK